jgi:hypothetical protein
MSRSELVCCCDEIRFDQHREIGNIDL